MQNPQLGQMAGGHYTKTIMSTDGITTEEQCAIQGPIVKIDAFAVWIEGWNRTVRIDQRKAYIVKTTK